MSSPCFPEFSARAPWVGPDLQTLRNVLRGPAIAPPIGCDTETLIIPLSDGSGDQLTASLLMPSPDTARNDAPLVVLVHGLGGSESSSYIQVTATHLLALGYPIIQLNLRGAGSSRPLCRNQYHAGRTGDFRDALACLASGRNSTAHFARNGIVAVGYSLGGNMVLKFAAEFGGLRAAISVSAPIDLSAASYRFLDNRNRFYHRYLLGQIRTEALAAEEGLRASERELLPKLRSILEFDDQFVAPRNGFAGAADYYRKNSACFFMQEIDVPTLVIHAKDDPWIPADSYLDFPWSRNTRLVPLIAKSGGHVGFHDRASRVPWHDRCIESFLEQLSGGPR